MEPTGRAGRRRSLARPAGPDRRPNCHGHRDRTHALSVYRLDEVHRPVIISVDRGLPGLLDIDFGGIETEHLSCYRVMIEIESDQREGREDELPLHPHHVHDLGPAAQVNRRWRVGALVIPDVVVGDRHIIGHDIVADSGVGARAAQQSPGKRRYQIGRALAKHLGPHVHRNHLMAVEIHDLIDRLGDVVHDALHGNGSSRVQQASA